MGTNASAVLFYGYCWSDEESERELQLAFHRAADPSFTFDEDEDDEPNGIEWEEALALKRGHVDPYSSFVASTARDWKTREIENDRWCATHKAEILAWYDVKEAIKSEFGVGVLYHGDLQNDCTAPHVCIASSRVSVEYTEGHAITSLEVDPAWREQLARWLAEFGIEPPQDEPQWWMVSDYG